MSIRLTKVLRHDIATSIFKHTIEVEAAEFNEKFKQAVETYAKETFGYPAESCLKRLDDTAREVIEKYLFKANSFRVYYGNETKDKQWAINLDEKCEIFMPSKLIYSRHFNIEGKLIIPDGEWNDLFLKLEEESRAMYAEHRNFRDKVRSMLDNCSTVEKLLDIFPECGKYYSFTDSRKSAVAVSAKEVKDLLKKFEK